MPRRSRTPNHQPTEEDPPDFDWSQVDSETFQFKIAFDPKPNSKKRKRGEPEYTIPQTQDNPLEGCRLPTVHYAVAPKVWDSITRYRKFTIASETFEVHDCVLVNLDPDEEATNMKKKMKKKVGRTSLPVHAIENRWIAHVLEVRAADEQHVFLRVNWLYRPEDLPSGRQAHHGAAELVPSNFMQIIDAMSVDGKVSVKKWDEENEDEEPNPDGLYFRQEYDHTKNKLSPVREHCLCKRPANPDKLLIRCSNPDCRTWLHAECLEKEALKTAYADASEPYPASEHNYSLVKDPPKYRKKNRGPISNGHTGDDKKFEVSVVPKNTEGLYCLQIIDHREAESPHWAKSSQKDIECLVCHTIIE